ncbi:MAG: Ig-like domain repeat protein [Methanobacteriota archaeon]|nr:MAG: Ig-like domain repeat protein [Euryarchaeota archaeon]
MKIPHERTPSLVLRLSVLAIVLLMTTPFASREAAAEIPHENYDLIGSDIDMVVAMLNASIRASEDALRGFYDRDVAAAQSDIAIAAVVVEPAAEMLDDIEEVAGSHDLLNVLIPPFSSLHEGMQDFSELEGRMLEVRQDIASVASEPNISDSDAIEVIESVRQVNVLLSGMNDAIDVMLAHAGEIDSLTIGDSRPFVPNALVELIERLKELTALVHDEITEMIEEGIPWQDDMSFLLLWTADKDLHLGETLVGGGYLIVNGTLTAGSAVNVSLDGISIAVRSTDEDGAFHFSHPIPLDVSWLGLHDLAAGAQIAAGVVESEAIAITVSLVSTRLSLTLSNRTVSPSENLVVETNLTRESGTPLPGATCVLSVDGSEQTFITGDDGRSEWTWEGSVLGVGMHTFSASFPMTLPYAACESGEMMVVVDVPTSLALNLFSDRLRAGYHLVGDGTLVANGTSPLADKLITLSVDGVVAANPTTDATGKFTFSIETDGMATGSHSLSAVFVGDDSYWRRSGDEVRFFIISLTYSDYPFFPWIPGWDVGSGLQEQMPYLFFGEYAYITWLFILLVVGVVIKALQARKRRAHSAAAPGSVSADGGTPSSAVSPDRVSPSLERMPDWLADPNEKVIWHYQSLLAFLKSQRRIGVADNMTHWEVARLLASLGYPQGDTSSVALLFEKAQYSGALSSEDDVLDMNSHSSSIRRSGGVRPAV